MSWKSRWRSSTSGSPTWDEVFDYDLVPLPSPNRPAPPLALLLRGAAATFRVYEKANEGQVVVGHTRCFLERLNLEHDLDAGYALTRPPREILGMSNSTIGTSSVSASNPHFTPLEGTEKVGNLYLSISLETTGKCRSQARK
mmetsp:Transcript_751/g.1102  ORF Transcript_751/g.1102 Transcript_751/m.1102 type:complete len:142 (-) Transcript_751:86-511(-)